ncbi:MAG: DUF2335 domain-containing protein [Chitinophagaceae bacterium]
MSESPTTDDTLEVDTPDPDVALRNLPEEVRKIIEQIPEGNRSKAIQAILISERSMSGHFQSPIPPPEILEGYNAAIPNGADRILKLGRVTVNA